ncbi:MAG: phosphatidate cytidylyltransferase [Faecousia sp.]
MLKTRIRTLLVFVPLCIIVLALSHIPYVFSCAITLLSLAGVYELYRAADRLARWPQLCASCLLAIAICIIGVPCYGIILPVAFAVAVLVFIRWMSHPERFRFAEGAKTAWIALMVPLFFRALVEIRQLEHGLFILLLVILSCILTDVSGYFIGGAFGRKHIAPDVSPNKTWAGSLGGLAVSIMGGCLCVAFASKALGVRIHYGSLCCFLAFTSIAGQFGDFSMSAIKRSVGIKDFSQLLPGHGGILDRFDSQLFAAPFALIFVTCIQILE